MWMLQGAQVFNECISVYVHVCCLKRLACLTFFVSENRKSECDEKEEKTFDRGRHAERAGTSEFTDQIHDVIFRDSILCVHLRHAASSIVMINEARDECKNVMLRTALRFEMLAVFFFSRFLCRASHTRPHVTASRSIPTYCIPVVQF